MYERLSVDEEFEKYARHTGCDASGHFAFEHVANGKYFVVTKIFYLLRWSRGGGALMESVEVRDGEEKKIVLEKKLEY
jgi:hypothetical protein